MNYENHFIIDNIIYTIKNVGSQPERYKKVISSANDEIDYLALLPTLWEKIKN